MRLKESWPLFILNVKLLGELNAKPLAARRKKHQARKEQQRAGRPVATEKSTKDGKSPFESEHKVRAAIDEQLQSLLARALQTSKVKQGARTVSLALTAYSKGAIADALLEERLWGADQRQKLIELFRVSPAQQDKLLRNAAVKYLTGDMYPDLPAEQSINLAEQLCVDLLSQWQPNDALWEVLTDDGRELLDAASSEIPEFLRPFFGLKSAIVKPTRKK